MSCLYDVLNPFVYNVDFVIHNNERACAEKHLQYPDSNTAVLFERGYFSYYFLYQIIQKNLNFVQSQEGNRIIRDFSDSNPYDLIASYTPSETVKSDLRKRSLLSEFSCLTLSLIKHIARNGGYILSTTLVERGYYETGAFHDLYHHR